MKISQKAPRGVPPRERPVSELSEDEKAERVGQAMREARAAAQTDEDEARNKSYLKLLLDAKANRPKELEHAAVMTMLTHNPGEEPELHQVVLAKPHPLVTQLMNLTVDLVTGLQWEGMPLSERAVFLSSTNQGQSLIGATSVLEVLPELSRNYLLAWQGLISDPSGHIWACSDSVGREGRHLITEGYCLLPHDGIETELTTMPSRSEVPQGSQGTPAFVQAVMGQAYLVWLQQQEALATD